MSDASLTLPAAGVTRQVLPNGLTVLVRRDPSAPVVAVVTYVKAGYFDETDDVVGIAHVLEHMYFKGTPTRGPGEVARQTKANGGYLNASTIYDHTRYYAVLPSSGFEAGLAIQADAYANSLIDAEELRRELEVIIQEANRKADNPGAVTTESLFELLHDRHRIRRWRIGREAGLRALTRDALHGFYRNFYRPRSTILAIVGDVDVAQALRLVDRHYGALPDESPRHTPGLSEEAMPGRRYRHLAGDVTHWHAAFGWRVPGPLNADAPVLDLSATILASGRASRLYRAVRERRHATSVAAWNYTPADLGVFVVQLEGEPGHVDAALGETWQQVHRLGDSVSSTEVVRAQRLYESRQLRRLESMEGQANWLADWEAQGGLELAAAHADATMAATPALVRDAVARHLDPGQASLLLYEPAASAPWAEAATAAFPRLDAHVATPVAVVPVDEPPAAPAVARGLVPERVEQEVHVFRTAGGVPILARRRAGAPIVHLGVYSSGGASREPAVLGGLGTLLTRAAIKGTRRRDADTVALLSELLGGGISPSASSDGLGWGLSVPTRALRAAVELLADVVLEPAFAPSVIETERGLARAQLAQLRDDMYRYPTRLATEVAFGAHPYARSPLGTDDGLAAVTADDLARWHEAQVRRGDLVLAVVGDLDPAEVAAVLADAFAPMRHAPVSKLASPVWTGGGAMRVEERDKSQTALAMAFPGPARGDPARHAAHLLGVIASGLGGRFFDELRDKRSLAYTVHVSPSVRAAAGMMQAYIATGPQQEDEARAGLLEQFARLCDEPVTDDELTRARTYALGTHAIAQQDPGHLLGEMMDAWMYGAGLHELGEVESRIAGVTAADIQRLCQRYLTADQRVEGVVRGRKAAPAGTAA